MDGWFEQIRFWGICAVHTAITKSDLGNQSGFDSIGLALPPLWGILEGGRGFEMFPNQSLEIELADTDACEILSKATEINNTMSCEFKNTFR